MVNLSLPGSIEVCKHSVLIRLNDQLIENGTELYQKEENAQFIVSLKHRLALKNI